MLFGLGNIWFHVSVNELYLAFRNKGVKEKCSTKWKDLELSNYYICFPFILYEKLYGQDFLPSPLLNLSGL